MTTQTEPSPSVLNTPTTTQPASAAQAQISTSTTTSTSTISTTTTATSTPKKPANKPNNKPVVTAAPTPPPAQVERVESPYSTPPESLETIDAPTRNALVNILCMPNAGTLRPISGSGVIIDPRGVILTNAHVAQFILLSESPKINLTCSVRTGSPASPRWKAVVLYIPSVWVDSHYQNINGGNVSGTGEHDYALLYITSDLQGNAVTQPFPYLPIETRANVAFESDHVLVAGYPAEFVGGIVAQQNLYAATSISTIQKLMTFDRDTVDVFSVGGVIEAQGGSSGGPVVNAWRHVVGIIVTTSEGASTAARDLHALSLNYIDRDITALTTKNLEAILSANISLLAAQFSRETTPQLLQKYISALSH